MAYVNSITKTDMTTVTAKNIRACHNSTLKDPNGRYQSKASKLSLEGRNIPACARPNDGKYVVYGNLSRRTEIQFSKSTLILTDYE